MTHKPLSGSGGHFETIHSADITMDSKSLATFLVRQHGIKEL